MLRRLALPAAVLAAAGTLTSLTSCTTADIQAEDVYRIGCPAVDAAVSGGSLTNKAAVAGLRQLRDSGQLNPDATSWVDATIGLLEATKPEDVPADARRLIVDGCAANGYPLQNLKG